MPVDDLQGFYVEAVELPRPLVPIGEDCRARLREVLAAAIHGETPEAIAGYVTDGFPERIAEALERPFEREEMDDFIDLLLYVQQTPAT